MIGPGTEIIAGEGNILTAGGMDALIHFICPQHIGDALASGITTMLASGAGPAHGTLATACTPGPWHIGRMLLAFDGLRMNLAFAGKGNASLPAALEEMVTAGAFAESRIRKETIAAEGFLHHMGAMSIIGSDSQAMGAREK